MTGKRIAQTNQRQKSEKPQASGILQRAGVRSVSDAEVQSTDDREAQPLSNSALSKDFSRVPISTTKLQQFQARNPQSHSIRPIQAKLTIREPGDRYEQEADRVASQVVQRINAPAEAGGKEGAKEHSPRLYPLVQPLSQIGIRKNEANRNMEVVQRALHNKIVKKEGFSDWVWSDNLNIKWGNFPVPQHPVLNDNVLHNELLGGYTIMDNEGKYIHSKQYGPYTPGIGKQNHVERKFWNAVVPDLEEILEKSQYVVSSQLVVIEINQNHTPCSGAQGCTNFLDLSLKEISESEVVSVVGRFKAYNRYDTGLSEVHPLNTNLKKNERMDANEEDMKTSEGLGAKVYHSYTQQDRYSSIT
ncbi:hypothetical protein [Nostoc sp. C117]|uniref:hypothetical protein n=1 Tax=Nostoc sp. C117 TaxID=3349875 RepID=UPI00370D3B34